MIVFSAILLLFRIVSCYKYEARRLPCVGKPHLPPPKIPFRHTAFPMGVGAAGKTVAKRGYNRSLLSLCVFLVSSYEKPFPVTLKNKRSVRPKYVPADLAQCAVFLLSSQLYHKALDFRCIVRPGYSFPISELLPSFPVPGKFQYPQIKNCRRRRWIGRGVPRITGAGT